MYTAGVIAFIAIMIILLKFPRGLLRKILWMDIPLDILVTALLMVMFAGTYSGMMAALIGGVIFSLAIWGLKLYMGYERPVLSTEPPYLRWENTRG